MTSGDAAHYTGGSMPRTCDTTPQARRGGETSLKESARPRLCSVSETEHHRLADREHADESDEGPGGDQTSHLRKANRFPASVRRA